MYQVGEAPRGAAAVRWWLRTHPRETRNAAYVLGAVVILWLLWTALAWVFGTSQVTATVTAKAWHRTVHIAQFVWTNESNHSGYPAGSRDGYTSQYVSGYSYTRTPSGQSCSYNSYKQYICTTTYTTTTYTYYGTQYNYQIREWHRSRDVTASGIQTDTIPATPPVWPSYTLQTDTDQPERYDGEDATYTVVYTAVHGHGSTYPQTDDQPTWAAVALGTGYTLTVDRLGHVHHVRMN